ncbi:L-glutaminase [Geoalkalibacter ferrihydriticus]|uniref:Glutaminase n=2 Tax=Geoalkalibacter ferrihydriticus TaxID=392333 RepID=A0A0C2HT75_9BACT|nr:glutaminase [Geoalkalibacter ferrihydriticus]KIH78015.1 glutaminase [Geoalkalibacter ferrihydriticus DSM 17813]SDM33029.1 L-glutaminase [Geoalkalibacter ferrihydriticus]
MKSVSPDHLQDILNQIHTQITARTDYGEVATYIPELACVDPKQFGLAVALADGRLLSVGDADVPFSIQSISKVFTLALALGQVGNQLWKRVGREPSGHAFNSILQLEHEKGIPRNPFINAGAIVVTDVILASSTPKEALAGLMTFIRTAADDPNIYINEAVARSEKETGHRNFALAHFMRSFGNLAHDPDLTLGTYFHQCALEMSCRQLAMAGRFLINAPGMPHLISPSRIRRINALMMTCGHYDGSGDFAFRVGLPGKSGVGGGILVIVPGKASIAVWSPGLTPLGNSRLGTEAVHLLAQRTEWSVFG